MNLKPPGLIYGVEDVPPAPVLALMGLQHVFLMSSTLVLPVILVSEIGSAPGQVQAVVATTMMACGLGTIVQAMRWPGIGSGYLCPNLCGPNFFSVSMAAAWLGGLPLMRGMTIAAGLIEVVFARVLRRIAFLFPTEITGLVVFMVAFGLVPLGVSKFFGIDYSGDPISSRSFAVAAIALFAMIAVNVWGKGLKLYGVLIGIAGGYLAALGLGLLGPADFQAVADAAWVGLPHYDGLLKISFDWALLPVWIIVSICGALKSFGNLVLCEKVNGRQFSQDDIGRIGNGLVADGFAVIASGALGGVASDTSASNVAFSGVSGATSRWIGVAAGSMFFVLGFSPKLAAVLSVMPGAVAGAILIFVVCFMMISGVQIMLASNMDVRKTFSIGIALAFGVSLDILPQLYSHASPYVRPLLDSSLTLSTVVAVVLSQLLRFKTAPAALEPPEEAG